MTKSEQMYAFIDARASTGKTIKSYCAEHGISPAKYNYWQRKRKVEQGNSSQAGFVSLRPSIVPESEQAKFFVAITLSGGLCLNFSITQLELAADLLLQMDRRHAEF